MEFVIDYYDLYGDDRLPLAELAYNLDLQNIEDFKARILDRLRKMDAEKALKEIAGDVADKHFQGEKG